MKVDVFFLVIVSVNIIHGSNILLLENVASRSHHLWHKPLINALLDRGHKITLLSVFPATPMENLTNYVMEGVPEKLSQKYNFLQMSNMNTFSSIMQLFHRAQDQCEAELSSNGIHRFISDSTNNHFDIVLMDIGSAAGSCFYSLIKHLGSPPIIATSPFLLPPISVYMTGGPACPSICPHFALSYTDAMSFQQRLVNTLLSAWYLYYYRYHSVPALESIANKYYNFNSSSNFEMEKSISFILANDDPIIGWPQPNLPSVISVAGLHIQSSKTMPKEIYQFLEDAKDGAILFTLGSNMRSSRMAPEKIKIFVEVFSRIPQNVLWKWESDPPEGLSDNVMIKDWLPQNEILGHKNTKAFIMHAGVLGVQESIYNGVPVVGIPFFFDQKFNSQKIIKKGFGVGIDYNTLTNVTLFNALQEVLYNPRYLENVKKASIQFRDQPQSPLEKAIFWIEYAIRHKGSEHMRSSAINMSFFQTHSIDVLIALFTIFIINVTLLFSFPYWIFRISCTFRTKEVKQKLS